MQIDIPKYENNPFEFDQQTCDLGRRIVIDNTTAPPDYAEASLQVPLLQSLHDRAFQKILLDRFTAVNTIYTRIKPQIDNIELGLHVDSPNIQDSEFLLQFIQTMLTLDERMIKECFSIDFPDARLYYAIISHVGLQKAVKLYYEDNNNLRAMAQIPYYALLEELFMGASTAAQFVVTDPLDVNDEILDVIQPHITVDEAGMQFAKTKHIFSGHSVSSHNLPHAGKIAVLYSK